MIQPSNTIKHVVLQSRDKAEEEETKARARALGLGYVNLKISPVQIEVLHILGDDISKKYRLIPYLKMGRLVRVATDQVNREKEAILEKLSSDLKLKLQLVLASPSSVAHGLGLLEKTKDLFLKRKTEKITISAGQIQKAIKTLAALQSVIKTIPITQLLELILAGAVGTRASDVHIVPRKQGAVLRFRVDGALQVVTILSEEAFKGLASRIKYLAKMEINKHHVPQDGSFSFRYENKDLDIRVSCLPTIYGESFVLRILETSPKMLHLEKLGFSQQVVAAIQEAIQKPNGLILNTGPTGSGKTTTLYAILNILNKPNKKIITIEDPVEYKLPGAVQIPVTKEVDFANGLRSILRHDPDIIMVGEIRDRETAEIAVQASLTGHLVLSTLHTNNAAGAFVRLLDLGIKPFLLAGNVNLVIAQRLVRRICPYCRAKIKISSEKKEFYKRYFRVSQIPDILIVGQGCVYCHGTGYLGRVAIGEVIKPSKKLNALLQSSPTAEAIESLAIKEGMVPMIRDGWNKVVQGITTPEEVVTKTSF